MNLCEKNIDCLECQTRGMCNSYAMFKYNQGRAEAIDECIKLIGENIKSIVGTYNKDTPLTDRASYRVAKNELIEELVKQLEQLKEQNNES